MQIGQLGTKDPVGLRTWAGLQHDAAAVTPDSREASRLKQPGARHMAQPAALSILQHTVFEGQAHMYGVQYSGT
jgi:hypothetical protein